MSHRKPRRFSWLPLLLLTAVGVGTAAYAVHTAPSSSVTQWQPPVHRSLPPTTPAPQKPVQPIVTLINYSVVSGDTLTGIAKAHCPSANDWQHLASFNRISDPGMLTVGEVITLAC